MPKDGFRFVDKDKVNEWIVRASKDVHRRYGKNHFDNRHIYIKGYMDALSDLLFALDSGVLCFQETE